MKRLLFLMMLVASISLVASAQTGLEINKVFGGKYVQDPSVTEALMSGDQRFLRSRHLSTWAMFKGDADTYAPIIQPLVLADGAHATGRNTRYKNGKLCYAFFILPKVMLNGKQVNRYIYYLYTGNRKKPTVTLIYFDGSLSRKQAEAIIRNF